MSEFVDTVVAAKTEDAPARGFSTGRVVQESLDEGNVTAHVEGDSFSEHRERHIPDAVLAKIDALAKSKPADVATDGETTGEEDPPEEQTNEEVALVEDKPTEETPTEEAKAEASPGADDLAALKAERDRFEDANRRLLVELETERKRPAAQTRPALLDAAESLYLEDAIGGLRHYLAAALGVEKADDPKVEQELRDLYLDLSAKEIGVTPDPAHQAKREAARTRQLWDREKRQRTAEEQRKANEGQQDADAKKAEAASAYIAPRLQQKASDYPLLTQLAEVFDGEKPEALIWKVLERESKTGRIALTADDDANIAAAAKLIESHYQALVDKVGKAKPVSQPSTAKPAKPSAVTSASQEQRQSHGARTLTTADASVAPAAPPAKKPAPKKDEPPKFKSNEERKQWALRHLKG